MVEGHTRRDCLVLEVAMVGDHGDDLRVELSTTPAPQLLCLAPADPLARTTILPGACPSALVGPIGISTFSPLETLQSPRYNLRILPAGYQPRIVDRELAARLSAVGAVVIEGPKACGKTATARQVAASEVLLDVDANARQAIAVDPALVLDGPTPRLLDEWQIEPTIWNHVRRAIDDRSDPAQFILTGSAVPPDDITRHTGAGRIARLRMRPMSLFETGPPDPRCARSSSPSAIVAVRA